MALNRPYLLSECLFVVICNPLLIFNSIRLLCYWIKHAHCCRCSIRTNLTVGDRLSTNRGNQHDTGAKVSPLRIDNRIAHCHMYASTYIVYGTKIDQ